MLRRIIHAMIYYGDEGGFVAECMEIGVVTQANSLDMALKNLKEAVQLYFEGEQSESLGFVSNPILDIHLETEVADEPVETAFR
ncbi:MAG: hypothetical protein IEMM0003_0739 [bacterium]|nr:MAG: hypothetical protein IEMM0003_0739 [bacterium]